MFLPIMKDSFLIENRKESILSWKSKKKKIRKI
jgi:hypothetical protein